MEIKTTEEQVLIALERNIKSRSDDFILYGCVLRQLGYNLKDTSLYDFLAKAKENKTPTFETVTRCRRHIQELRQDLIDNKCAINRQSTEIDFKNYNNSGIGDDNK